MPAWYNEIDPGAAATLEELIHEGHLPAGVVDRRSIKDVRASDLRGFDQHHFFAGFGIWPAAARAAGWPDARPIWTGSCPCQPFSAAGKGFGFDDPRHLWPDWFRLIAECRPDQIFGEQVATAGLWLDLVRTDMEGLGAAFGCPDLPAAGFAEGAHIRQRLYWMADLHDAERWADVAAGHFGDWPQAGRVEGHGEFGTGGAPGRLGLSNVDGEVRQRGDLGQAPRFSPGQRPDFGAPAVPERAGATGGLGHHHQAGRIRLEERDEFSAIRLPASRRNDADRPGPLRGLEQADWLFCRDERWRPVEAGTFPLAASDPARVGLLRGYGNALDFETAKGFVSAFLEAEMLS